MRPVERIDNFLSKVDWNWLTLIRWKLRYPNCGKPITPQLDNIVSYWKQNPDQRIGQVLINLGILPDSLLIWNDEEADILEAQGLPPEEYLFWTSYLDVNENKLDKPITRLVKDLTKEHVLAIKAYALRKNTWLPSEYNTAFNNVLKQ